MEGKIWFLQIHGRQEGPYSVEELCCDPRVTQDTLVWKSGFPTWVAIKYVPELKEIFKGRIRPFPSPPPLKQEEEAIEKSFSHRCVEGKDVLALDWYRETPPWLLLILVILTLSIYVWYKFH